MFRNVAYVLSDLTYGSKNNNNVWLQEWKKYIKSNLQMSNYLHSALF